MRSRRTKFPVGYGSKRKHVHWGKGEQNANVSHTWAIVRAIRAAGAEGMRFCDIARKFNVNPGSVYKIVHNQQWIE